MSHSAEKDRPYCLRCEVPIYRDEQGVWRREATGVADCPRNPANDGHEPMPDADKDAGDDDVVARLHAELDRRGVPRFSVADMTPEQRNRLRAVGVNLPPESSYTRDLPPGGSDA